MGPEYDEKALFEWFEATTGQPWDFSEAGKAVWIAYHFDQQVCNGGFHQAFLNLGDHWKEIRAALATIGATSVIRLFDEALSVFPPDGPAENQRVRYGQLSGLQKNSLDLLWRLDGNYYDLKDDECIYNVMYRCLVRAKLLPWRNDNTK